MDISFAVDAQDVDYTVVLAPIRMRIGGNFIISPSILDNLHIKFSFCWNY